MGNNDKPLPHFERIEVRRTPDKDTILKLRSEGLSLRKIGKRYGVSDSAIKWALTYVPKVRITDTCHIPQHVTDYWRNEWGWTDELIKEKVSHYNQSLLRR